MSNRQLFTAKVSEKELSSSEHHDINFQPRTSRGWEAVSPCQPTIVGLGKRHKLPERGRGRSPGQKWVLVHFELEKNTSGGKKFVFVDISHFCYTVIVYVSEMGRTDQAPCARGVSPHQPPPLVDSMDLSCRARYVVECALLWSKQRACNGCRPSVDDKT